MKKIISTNIDGVRCVIGQRTRQPNAITMVIDPADVIEAVELYEARKRGLKPEHGLIGYELVAIYADKVEVDLDEERQPDLKNLVPDEEVEESIEADKQLICDNCECSDFKNIRDGLKCVNCGRTYHFEEKEIKLPCIDCACSCNDEPCSLECLNNPESESKIDLFEPIPMSQRLE